MEYSDIILAYLTNRYFGVANFGRIYGILFASFLVGTFLGPYAFGLAFESYRSYREVLMYAVLVILVSSAVISVMIRL